jgi:DNA-binding FrmR family transcriptional regulator
MYTPWGYTAVMPEIEKRLHRLQGQLTSLETAIAADTPCATVIPQLLASKGALDAVVKAYLEEAMDSCLADADPEALKQVTKLFIKHVS